MQNLAWKFIFPHLANEKYGTTDKRTPKKFYIGEVHDLIDRELSLDK